ncbi:hypothetical protein [Adhaeretor mobilis]|uniref:PEP-CTERM protein-sorting domain-containing protein n=1 Tax=Adhaeretor mobilis TaxID=1930276 RepID=A0A517MQ77_9BACT|nr:hypothetical protein [Adhaeretor mobilis]QDS96937.1 hypothetical protein HG15A2_01960 [Adhaeretor mobilis]
MITACSRLRPQLPRHFLAGVCALLTLPSASQATTTIVDSGGFESSAGYTIAPNSDALEGQQGWVTTQNNAGSATVQNTVFHPNDGTQAVEVVRGALSDDRWAVPVGPLTIPNDRLVLVDWDMAVPATGAPSGTGPFFGVETYDATSGFNVLGTLGVDGTTGDVMYQAQSTGVLTEAGMTVFSGQWHHFQIRLDFGQNQYQALLDNTALVSTGFVDGPSNQFTDADIAALAAAFDGNSQNQTGTAYFDNFLVRGVSRADFDIDEDVDGVDLSIWQTAYGVSGAADANLDGNSDGADFLIWQREYVNTPAPLVSATNAVPEPSGLALVLLAALCSKVRIR